MDQEVVEPDGRDRQAERLERQAVIPGRELKLLQPDGAAHVGRETRHAVHELKYRSRIRGVTRARAAGIDTRLQRGGVLLLAGLGLAVGLACSLFPRVIMRILCGPGFTEAAPVLRVLGLAMVDHLTATVHAQQAAAEGASA